MALEDVMVANTTAMQELTKALLAGKAGKPATTTTTTAKEPAHTFAEVTAQCIAVKTALGDDKAKELIKDVGKAKILKEVKPENFDALYDACAAALAAADESGGL